MNGWAEAVRRVLDRAPTRALPLPRLLEELAADGIPVEGREEWILNAIAQHPEHFRILPTGVGPWAEGAGDPWILFRDSPRPAFGPLEGALRHIQVGLQAWGGSLDRASQPAVARWIRANLEGEESYRALRAGA